MAESNKGKTEENQKRIQFVLKQVGEGNGGELRQFKDAIGISVQRREDFLRDILAQAKDMQKFAMELGIQFSACNVVDDEIVQLIIEIIQKGAGIIEKRVDGQENFSEAEIELLLVSNDIHENLMRWKLGQPHALLLTSSGLEKIFEMMTMFPQSAMDIFSQQSI